jgi:hypothetical protein
MNCREPCMQENRNVTCKRTGDRGSVSALLQESLGKRNTLAGTETTKRLDMEVPAA